MPLVCPNSLWLCAFAGVTSPKRFPNKAYWSKWSGVRRAAGGVTDNMISGLRRFLAMILALGVSATANVRAGIIETSVFSEEGVKVDDTAATAADAKNQ